MLHISRYTSADREAWDAFVRSSRNGTFMFERAYMEYHNDRFTDHSLLFYDEKQHLLALLPACDNEEEKNFSSHAGLTFGGFVINESVRAVDVLELFSSTKEYLGSLGFQSWIYKSVPTIYHTIPSEEEEYALWMNDARLEVCNLSTAIDLRSRAKLQPALDKIRRQRRAEMQGYVIEETSDFSQLWPIVDNLLRSKYGVAPVHSLEEITRLQSSFPDNIRCFVAKLDGTVQGGIVIYESQQVAHAQYCETTEIGKTDGISDLLYLNLIKYYSEKRPEIRYFDFGISNEQRGRYLNKSLAFYKEHFGGRGITYKTYLISLSEQ